MLPHYRYHCYTTPPCRRVHAGHAGARLWRRRRLRRLPARGGAARPRGPPGRGCGARRHAAGRGAGRQRGAGEGAEARGRGEVQGAQGTGLQVRGQRRGGEGRCRGRRAQGAGLQVRGQRVALGEGRPGDGAGRRAAGEGAEGGAGRGRAGGWGLGAPHGRVRKGGSLGCIAVGVVVRMLRRARVGRTQGARACQGGHSAACRPWRMWDGALSDGTCYANSRRCDCSPGD